MISHIRVRQCLIAHLVLHCAVRLFYSECRALAPGLDDGSSFDSFKRWLALESRSRPIKFLQLLDLVERSLTERGLAVEGVQDDSLQQIAQSQIVVLSECL